jgi:hypothetical protein
MDLHIPGDSGREYATALAPAVDEISAPYDDQAIPTLVVRRNGEAWDKPFAVVFEPHEPGANNGTVQSVTKLEQNGKVVGLEIESTVDENGIIQYVISNPEDDEVYTDETTGISFTGRFAVITDHADGSVELYIGDGSHLSYGGLGVSSQSGTNTQASVIFSASQEPTVTSNDPVTITVPNTALEDWRLLHFDTTANTGTAADDYDANFDGESNLLEFATAQDPHASSLATTLLYGNIDALEFEYVRSKAALADGALFSAEWSDTLLPDSWSQEGVTESLHSQTNEVETIRASVPSNEDGRRFYRLKVDL